MKVIKYLPHPLTPQVGSKLKHLIFVITQQVVNIFTEISHADRGTTDMKYITQDFSLKAHFNPFGWTLGIGQRPKFNFFRIWSCCISN